LGLAFFKIRHGFAGFPFRDGLPRHADRLGDGFLGQLMQFPQLHEIVFKHAASPS
jgi:hypothetical protein